jgi:hypothetical protein
VEAGRHLLVDREREGRADASDLRGDPLGSRPIIAANVAQVRRSEWGVISAQPLHAFALGRAGDRAMNGPDAAAGREEWVVPPAGGPSSVLP